MKRIILLIVLLAMSSFVMGCNKEVVNVADYISVSTEGYSGYAVATTVLDKDGLKAALVSKADLSDKDAEAFVESVALSQIEGYVSNGQRVTVSVSSTNKNASNKRILIKDAEILLEDIEEPIVYDVFKELEVKIEGISPKASVNYINNSTDPYISKLVITVEPQDFVKVGDKVTVSIDVNQEEEGKKGIAFKSVTQEYVVGEISSYATLEKIDTQTLKDIDEKNIDAVKKETADSTKHMMWRITGNREYLLEKGAEKVVECELVETYFLKEKELVAGQDNNYIYYMYKVAIANNDKKETGYFIFEYKNAVIIDGKFYVSDTKTEERYKCNQTMENLYSELIEGKLDEYEMSQKIILK